MRVTIDWLRSYLGRTISDHQIIKALEDAGVEVESYSPGRPLDKKIIVGMVKQVSAHPHADRLRLAQVNVGKEVHRIVCGAPNLEAGQRVAVAQVGSKLPDGQLIREATLRGELSQGMICSERELGLGNDHDGILVLPAESRVGHPLSESYPSESIIDIKTSPNRIDILSLTGLAREVCAFTEVKLKLPSYPELVVGGGPSVGLVVNPQITNRFMVAELTVQNGGQAVANRSWLEAAGVRSISPVVDVTNIAMLEWGQPLHAYDASKVKGYLRVRWASRGEKLTTLDGVERALTTQDLVIADNAGPVGLAGVMGGQRTEVGAKTKRILLEAATFDPGVVRKMALRHSLRTEASARFERGLPVQLAPFGMACAIELLIKQANGKLVGVTDELRIWPWTQRIGLRRSRLNKLLGTDISTTEAVTALSKLGIQSGNFDLVKKAKEQLHKPYIWGASFKKNGVEGFDCSYLTDYLYSLIGRKIGYTSLAQYEIGQPVSDKELQPGDQLFYSGPEGDGERLFSLQQIQSANSSKQPRSAVGSYYLFDEQTGTYVKKTAQTKKLVGHNGLYIGDGRVIHAAHYSYQDGEWKELHEPKVEETDVEVFTKNPSYLGARRYVEDIDDWISVPEVPWWRPDLRLEEDLVEEVVRVIGYDRIPARLPAWRPEQLTFDDHTPKLWHLRELLLGLGLFEVMTYSFISEEQVTRLGLSKDQHLKLKNPLSREQAYLRRTALPSLLTAIGKNDRYASEFSLYELTRLFVPGAEHSQLPTEPYCLSLAVKGQGEVYSGVKGVLDVISKSLNLRLQVSEYADAIFVPGRGAQIKLGKRVVGLIGEVALRLVEGEKIRGRVAWLELNVDELLAAVEPLQSASVSRFPSISRDVNLIVKRSVTWAQVAASVEQVDLAQATFLNDYYAAELGPTRKHIAIRLTMSDAEKTLTDEDADRRLKSIVSHLRKQLGAEPVL